MDRTIRLYESFEAAEEADLEDWLALSAEERFEIGEALREEAFSEHEPGLQRVLRLVEREGG